MVRGRRACEAPGHHNCERRGIAATAVFLAAFPWFGGMRRPLLTGALGIGGSLALVVVFMRVAYISLPLGEGPFRALSLALLAAIGVS